MPSMAEDHPNNCSKDFWVSGIGSPSTDTSSIFERTRVWSSQKAWSTAATIAPDILEFSRTMTHRDHSKLGTPDWS